MPKDDQLERLVAAIRANDITVPDEVFDHPDPLKALTIAVLANAGGSGRRRDEDFDDDGYEQTSGATEPAPGAPMLMSDGRGGRRVSRGQRAVIARQERLARQTSAVTAFACEGLPPARKPGA